MGWRELRRPRLTVLHHQLTPTRGPTFDILYDMLGDRLQILYSSELEGDRDRSWTVPSRHPYRMLMRSSLSYTLAGMKRYVHLNPDTLPALRQHRPDCIVAWGFQPPALQAWMYSRAARTPFVVAGDGCLRSDRNTPLHVLVRKVLVPTAAAAVGASIGSFELFNKYADFKGRFFYCYVCANNQRLAHHRHDPREYDVMFSGQFVDRKLPHFFADVVIEMQRQKPDTSALLVGDGPLRGEVLRRLERAGVRFSYPGFLPPSELPAAYGKARLLLFASKLDAYGVVANEAMAAGVPVISNDEPGAVGEAILHERTGLVLPLDHELWAQAAIDLLADRERYDELANAGFAHVQRYTFRAAAEGLRDAFEYALGH